MSILQFSGERMLALNLSAIFRVMPDASHQIVATNVPKFRILSYPARLLFAGFGE
jgi:hypothetical protein